VWLSCSRPANVGCVPRSRSPLPLAPQQRTVSFMKALILLLVAGCGLVAAGPAEREPVALEVAKGIAANFHNLRLGMTPEQVQCTLGLEAATGKMVRYEGIAHYEGSRDLRRVQVCVMRDGYAFSLIYIRSATNGLTLSEWLWRPELDWPKSVTNLTQRLASLGNPQAGTQALLLHRFAVDVKPGSFMPVSTMVFIDVDRFEEVSAQQAEMEKCVTSRLTGLTMNDLTEVGTLTAIQLDIRCSLNSKFTGHPIRYVSLGFDIK
jgi:hypothetical protein